MKVFIWKPGMSAISRRSRVPYTTYHYPGPMNGMLADGKSCMPELPEVQTVVTTLRPRVLGCQIVAVNIARRRLFSLKALT